MTDQLIAPVIPPANDPARSRPGRVGAGRPLPLAGPLSVPLDAVYGMSRIDASGRLASQADGLYRLSGRIPQAGGHPIDHHVAGRSPRPRA
jgi:hypothetical protein